MCSFLTTAGFLTCEPWMFWQESSLGGSGLWPDLQGWTEEGRHYPQVTNQSWYNNNIYYYCVLLYPHQEVTENHKSTCSVVFQRFVHGTLGHRNINRALFVCIFTVLTFVFVVYRFVCEETVEEKISALQEKKKELAQNVLSGTGSTFTKLSLADLRIIFGVWDGRRQEKKLYSYNSTQLLCQLIGLNVPFFLFCLV